MALRPLNAIEKNKLLNYSDFVGTVEQAAREKARIFNAIDLHSQALPVFGDIATRQELARIKIFSQGIRDGNYSALDLAKRFLQNHTANIDDTNTAVDVITTFMQAQGHFDTFIGVVFRESASKIEM